MPKLRHLAIVTPNRERLVKFYTRRIRSKSYLWPAPQHASFGWEL